MIKRLVRLRNMVVIILGMLLITIQTTQAGECIDGMYSIYDERCAASELETGNCTTRYESTPESYWCCCKGNAGTPSENCNALFGKIFPKKNTSSKMMSVAREFNAGVLLKDKLGEKYSAIYYKQTKALTYLLAKNPKLALQTASILKKNRSLMSKLSSGENVKVKAQQMLEILALLKRYGEAAGKNSEIYAIAQKLTTSLMDKVWLEKLGIIVTDRSGTVYQNSDKKPDDGDPTTCDKPKGGMCPNVPQDDKGGCPKGCNKVNAKECSCKRTGPEGKQPQSSGSMFNSLCNTTGICW